jgi:hypothetical protein
VTSPEVCFAHSRLFPALFSYYSSRTKYTIAHDRHGYRMWRDRKSRDLKWGLPVLSSGVFGYFRGFWLWTMLFSTPRVLSITSAFSLWYFY